MATSTSIAVCTKCEGGGYTFNTSNSYDDWKCDECGGTGLADYFRPTITAVEAELRRTQYGASFPAISGTFWADRIVTQGHADYCHDFGHATWAVDGTVQPMCPRCGVTLEVASTEFCPVHGPDCEAWA